jgi:pre-60S factor REI1
VTGPGFASAAEQRLHFKTDWHRYNVRRRVAKKPPVAEEQFDRIVEDEEDVSARAQLGRPCPTPSALF